MKIKEEWKSVDNTFAKYSKYQTEHILLVSILYISYDLINNFGEYNHNKMAIY
jgi:hypothetical protein